MAVVFMVIALVSVSAQSYQHHKAPVKPVAEQGFGGSDLSGG